MAAGISTVLQKNIFFFFCYGQKMQEPDDKSLTSDHDWCNKGRGLCYPVCGMIHIKETLLLIGKSNPCGCSGFPHSLSEERDVAPWCDGSSDRSSMVDPLS